MRYLMGPGLALFFFTALPAHAQSHAGQLIHDRTGMTGIELVGGYGEKTDNWRLTANWYLFSRTIAGVQVDFSLGANFSVFDGKTTEEKSPRMKDLGLTPTATINLGRGLGPFQPYLEMGIGLHYLTDKQFTTKDFSTNFQFGDHIGMGLRFGEQGRQRLAYQFQHLSNAGISNPNPGINFHLVSYGLSL